MKGYKLHVQDPVFFSSRDGNIIRTSKMISSTAIMHALGYKFSSALQERFLNTGEDFSNPNYEHLKNIGFYTTDANPIEVDVKERTVRNTHYMAETGVSIQADQADTNINIENEHSTTKGFPKTQHTSKATEHQFRDFLGISPGSELELVIWDLEDIIPDSFNFRCGIGRSGVISCEKTQKPDETIINKFLLQKFADEELIMDMIDNYTLIKENDPRLHHFESVPPEKFEEIFIQENKDKITY